MKQFLAFIAIILFIGINQTVVYSQNLINDYFGQIPPGDTPKIFAPGIVSVDNKNSHALVFSPDGKMIIFSRYPDGTSYIISKENDKWSEPVESFFHGKEISFSPDGNKIFYYNGGDIFYVEKTTTGWSQPDKLGPNINTDSLVEFYPSIVKSGDLYFSRDGNWKTSRLMYSKFQNGEYQKAVDIGLPINNGGALHAWVSPDESYILFNSPRTGSYTGLDIWISFRKNNGNWSNPRNLGNKINSGADAILCPTVSPDGKYMFFTKLNFNTNTGFIYWVSTGIIDSLKAIEDITGIKYGKSSSMLKSLELKQNYPNPFNPSTLINYQLSNNSNVELTIYDVLGQKIKTLVDSIQNAGEHSVIWNAVNDSNNPVSSGIYFYRLETKEMSLQKKMILIR